MKRIGSLQKIMALLLVMMLVFIAACGSGTTNKPDASNTGGNGAVQTEAPASPKPEETPDSAETQYPLTVKDDTGFELTLQQAPTAVVSLAPSETETLYAIGAGEQVVGVDEYSNFPEEAATKAKIGDMAVNIEAVAALNPDLVVASSSMNFEAIEQLRALNISVYATDPLTYDAVVAKIEMLGKIMNKQSEAAKVAQHMQSVKEQVVASVKDAPAKKVYLEFAAGWTVGTGTFLDELITLAGGQNIAGSQAGWFEVSAETVVTENPEIIIYPVLGEEPNPILAAIESRPGWEAIDAMKNGSLHAVTEDPLVRVGPRLADGLLELVSVIHPDSMKQ